VLTSFSDIDRHRFAPRRHRHKMLSAVFLMQPIGALLANIISIIAIRVSHHNLPTAASKLDCTDDCAAAIDSVWRWIVGIGAIPPALAILIRWWIPESPRYTLEVERDPHRAARDIQMYYQPAETLLEDQHRNMEDGGQPETIGSASSSLSSSPGQATLAFGEPNAFGEPGSEMKDIELTDSAMPPTSPTTAVPAITIRKETWAEFWSGLRTFLIKDGNWTTLAGTSLSWMTLDFAFYFLSVNSPDILNKLWDTTLTDAPLYNVLLQDGYRSMIAVSTGAVLGGALFIVMARYRWQLQFYGFWILAGTFAVVGACFVSLLGTRYFAAVIVLYSICSLVFNLGESVVSLDFSPPLTLSRTQYFNVCHCGGGVSHKV
jgi:PHS family inorganic phosphate transporter-like MFS transporter